MNKTVQRLLTGVATAGLDTRSGARGGPCQCRRRRPYHVLVVGKTLGFRHSHIDDTTRAVISAGRSTASTSRCGIRRSRASRSRSTPFTTATDLSKYATIIFASPVDGTNNLDPARPRLLNDTELAAFQGYIRSGGGYVGLHAATDSMHTVPWYSELTGGGARFRNHPAQQTATMRVESPTHPSTTMLPAEWVRFDEWYNYTTNPREDVHVLITLDESTYKAGGARWGPTTRSPGARTSKAAAPGMKAPVTRMPRGPTRSSSSHVLGGIEWTAGLATGGGDCVTFGEVDEPPSPNSPTDR